MKLIENHADVNASDEVRCQPRVVMSVGKNRRFKSAITIDRTLNNKFSAHVTKFGKTTLLAHFREKKTAMKSMSDHNFSTFNFYEISQ